MIKKIKGSLFIKVFITTAILLTGVSFLVYLILAWYTPKTYSNTLNATLDEQTKIFISEISQMPMEETGGIFDNFLDYQNVDRMELFEENGNRINLPTERSADNDVVIETKAWGNEDNNAPIISNSYTVSFLGKNTNYTLALGSALLVGVVAGCSSSVNISSDNNTTKNVSYQAQTVSDTENAANDSTTAELPGGSVDYSIYEPYGLSYDQENYYFTYNGNVVRFFNDPIAGASFTNFFSGTVDIEADRDEENNLVGIKECSKENYDRHTQKHNNFNPTDTSLSTVQKGESTPQLWLKDYADYGITYNEQSGGWYYNNQRIKILLDSEQAVVYTDEENGVCVTISRDGNHQISEIKEISETDAQSLMLKNNPIGEDYTSQE